MTLWMAAVAPLLLASVLPDHVRTLVCRFSGAVMTEECCRPESDQTAQTQTELRDESCCVVRTTDLRRLVSDRPAETGPIRHYELRAVASQTVLPAPITGAAVIRSVAPPAVGPPIVLLKRSFLI
jgi:hypothetical protein